MQYGLSILIRTIVGRENFLSDLVCDLIRQGGSIRTINSSIMQGCAITVLGFDDVEIIIAKDNCSISSGAKLQLLLELAKKDFVTAVDDDDSVYPYFVSEILKAIQDNPDCVGTKGIYSHDGAYNIEWRLSKDYPNDTIYENGAAIYRRTTNHISPVKRSLALQVGYPNISNAEDKWYSERLNPLLKTEVKIDKLMYHYKFVSTNKSYN